MDTLDAWIERQYRHAASAMRRSISATQVTKQRPGAGQIIVPRKGAIVASPVPAAYDPDPDYFFHWYRDSAIVMDALRILLESGSVGPEATEDFADFVRFSLALQDLDGREQVSKGWRVKVAQDFAKHLRSDAELTSVHGDAVWAETRVNPDGTLDILSWPRPQYDGPATRALAVLRWMDSSRLDAEVRAQASELLRSDLTFTQQHWPRACFDIWEEEQGQHYYTLRVSAAALERGAHWLDASGQTAEANRYRQQADEILEKLTEYWLPDEGYYRSRVLVSGARSIKELDISVILAVVHTWDQPAPYARSGHSAPGQDHSVHDPRIHATLERLESLFDREYAINHDRPAIRGSALGRYAGDVYYSGGAYYFSTLGAAELCFRAAVGAPHRLTLLQRGDAFLETVRAFTPPSGDMSEQFDRTTGAQTSAKQLAWSYAAFISCIAARRAAMSG